MRNLLFATGLALTFLLSASAANLADGVTVAMPSLVHITVNQQSRPVAPELSTAKPERDRVVPFNQSKSEQALGSGVVLSEDGYILSVAHLFENVRDVFVSLNDRKQYKAALVGTDKRLDVALLKIEAKGLVPAKIGDLGRLRLGESVFAAGVPFHMGSPVVTDGVVSLYEPDSVEYIPLIQTTTPVTPGMGGGGLFNQQGELIGIVSVVYSKSGFPMTMTFSVPVDLALTAVPSLKEFGRVRRSAIGVTIADVSEEAARVLGLPFPAGALIQKVEPGGPADKAGIQPGDIVIRIGERKITQSYELPKAIGTLIPGSTVTVEAWRKGRQETFNVTTRELRISP